MSGFSVTALLSIVLQRTVVGFFCLLCVLMIPLPLEANKTNYFFSNYDDELEIPNSYVIEVLQDNQGFIWSATQKGLYRFDGHIYKEFIHNPADRASLPNNYINTIFLDKSGRLWVGSDGGLSLYDEKQETFKNYTQTNDASGLNNSIVMSITQSKDGVYWLGTWGGGISRFDSKNESFSHFTHDQQNPTSLSDNLVYRVYEDSEGVLWVGTRNGGLNQLDKTTGKFKRFVHDVNLSTSLSHNKVYAIFEDSKKTLWFGTRGGGLNRFNRLSESFEHFRFSAEHENSISSDHIFSILEDNSGSLWVGTHEGGLNFFDSKEETFQRYHHNPQQNSVSSNNIWSIIQDHDGQIWLGTFGNGLSQFDPNIAQFGKVQYDKTNANGFDLSYVRAFYVDKNGATWVGMQSGLYFLDRNATQFVSYVHDDLNPASLSANYIKSIYEDSQGNVWVGTSNGLNRYNRQQNSFTRFYHDASDPNTLSDNFIVSIIEDKQGFLWVGTQNGLNRLNRDMTQFRRYLHLPSESSSISHNGINTLYSSDDGMLWIGTSAGGLNRYNHLTDTFNHYKYSQQNEYAISSNVIFSIDQDSQGIFWIGTENGLNRFDARTEQFAHYMKKEGLKANRVLAVMVDGNDKIWLGESGISFFDPITKVMHNYVGASAGCFGASQGAYHQTAEGKMFFGIESFCAFESKDVSFNRTPPKVVLTDFLLLNKSVAISEQGILTAAIDHTNSITLDHENNVFSFEFSALDFFIGSDTQFQYRLDGFNKDWIETNVKNRRATYTNLAPGKYTFYVKARSAQGLWSNQAKSVTIIIKAAPWHTWWAYSIYAFIVFAILGSFIHLLQQKIKLERINNVKLERKVLARTKELDEKNKSLNLALQQLEEIAVTDQLTNAYNRRFLEKFIDKEIAQVERARFDKQDTRLGFIVIDVDHFKRVNDTYGHEAGDKVLIKLVDILKSSCRASDWVVRLGGEEFVIVTRFAQQVELYQLADRLKAMVAKTQFELCKDHKINLTCSLGLASYPFITQQPKAYTWQQTLNLADVALYEAKHNGRNRWLCLSEKEIKDAASFYSNSTTDLQSQVKVGIVNYTESQK